MPQDLMTVWCILVVIHCLFAGRTSWNPPEKKEKTRVEQVQIILDPFGLEFFPSMPARGNAEVVFVRIFYVCCLIYPSAFGSFIVDKNLSHVWVPDIQYYFEHCYHFMVVIFTFAVL